MNAAWHREVSEAMAAAADDVLLASVMRKLIAQADYLDDDLGTEAICVDTWVEDLTADEVGVIRRLREEARR